MELQKNNEKIKYLRKLSRRQFRWQQKQFIIEGVRFTETLLQSCQPVEALFYAPKLQNSKRGNALLEQAGEQKTPCWLVSDELLNQLSDTGASQGVLALVNMLDHQLEDLLPENKPALVVLVDGVQDPGNLGTIIRTADALGATGVILLKGTVDLYNPKTLRSTMGSLFHLPVITVENKLAMIKLLRQNGLKLVIGQPQGGVPISQVDLSQPIALVVGNEASGSTAETLEMADAKITIPLSGKAESLNVAVACAIILYETTRQRNL